MVRPGSLNFGHGNLEKAFRREWDSSSAALVRLLSLLTLLTWMTAWRNIHTHCSWSEQLCKVVEAVCCLMTASQAYYQFVTWRHPSSAVPETNKAWVWVADLTASMIFVLLLRDLHEVPGGTHGWIYTCHGWAALFVQGTSVSALHLHMLNLLCYFFVEAYITFEFGLGESFRGGLRHFLLLLVSCGLVPYAANVFIEGQRRQDFLNRHRRSSAAQVPT